MANLRTNKMTLNDIEEKTNYNLSTPVLTHNPGQETTLNATKPVNLPSSSMAGNVNSFLNGIRASFRSENVNVVSPPKSKKGCSNCEKN